MFGDTGGAGGAEGGQGGGASFCSACWKRATGAGKTGNAITSNGERRTTNPMYGSGVEMKTVEGEGMPCTGAAERRRGDLVIRFNIAFPQQVSQGDQLTLKTVLNKK